MIQALVLTRGLPASGKSTYAKSVVELNPNWVRLERDLLRDQLFNTRELIPSHENVITQVQFAMAEAAIKAGQSVIVSDMNLRASYVRDWAKLAAKYNIDFEQINFGNVSVDECVARDKVRDNAVGEEVIRSIAKRFLVKGRIPSVDVTKELSSGWTVDPVEVNSELPSAIIVDIDGTLATMNGRSPYEWHRVGEDSPVEAVINAVESAYAAGHEVIFMSGRDASCRDQTINWLLTNLPSVNGALFMRPEGDNRKDDLVKYELFNENVRGKFNVKYVLDDRDQVVKMWRALGLSCFQVNYGAF